jgi:hypothetical protein
MKSPFREVIGISSQLFGKGSTAKMKKKLRMF